MARRKKRVLVVEDDAATRSFLVDSLTLAGYEALPVGDGRAALEYLASCGADQPDVIVLDLYMPLVDGREFARAYRALKVPQAHILLSTAVPDASKQAVEIGAEAALTKPFGVGDLLAEVERQTYRDAA
jgi:CheY-like chemotaxis protein